MPVFLFNKKWRCSHVVGYARIYRIMLVGYTPLEILDKQF